MAFGVIEWFVLVFSILAIVKLITVSFSPRSWLNVVKPLYKAHIILFIIEIVLAAALLYYLLMDLTIIQIMGGIVLGALLTGMTFAVYGKETLEWGKKLLREKTLLRRAWLPILIWLALVIWVLIELF
jgi:hypothetical protein